MGRLDTIILICCLSLSAFADGNVSCPSIHVQNNTSCTFFGTAEGGHPAWQLSMWYYTGGHYVQVNYSGHLAPGGVYTSSGLIGTPGGSWIFEYERIAGTNFSMQVASTGGASCPGPLTIDTCSPCSFWLGIMFTNTDAISHLYSLGYNSGASSIAPVVAWDPSQYTGVASSTFPWTQVASGDVGVIFYNAGTNQPDVNHYQLGIGNLDYNTIGEVPNYPTLNPIPGTPAVYQCSTNGVNPPAQTAGMTPPAHYYPNPGGGSNSPIAFPNPGGAPADDPTLQQGFNAVYSAISDQTYANNPLLSVIAANTAIAANDLNHMTNFFGGLGSNGTGGIVVSNYLSLTNFDDGSSNAIASFHHDMTNPWAGPFFTNDSMVAAHVASVTNAMLPLLDGLNMDTVDVGSVGGGWVLSWGGYSLDVNPMHNNVVVHAAAWFRGAITWICLCEMVVALIHAFLTYIPTLGTAGATPTGAAVSFTSFMSIPVATNIAVTGFISAFFVAAVSVLIHVTLGIGFSYLDLHVNPFSTFASADVGGMGVLALIDAFLPLNAILTAIVITLSAKIIMGISYAAMVILCKWVPAVGD